MRTSVLSARTVAAVAAATLAIAPGALGAPAGQLSISVSPPNVTLLGGQSTTLSVRNFGQTPTWIDVTTGNFDVTPAGKVRVDPPLTPSRSARSWLTVSPARLRLAANGTGQVTVTNAPPRIASPGDHHALVLFTTAGNGGAAVNIKARLGVTVLVRVTGPLRRAITLNKPVVARRNKRRYIAVRLGNNGNITERLTPKNVTVVVRMGRTRKTLRGTRLTILPGTKRVVWALLPKSMKGSARVNVRITPANAPSLPKAKRISRSFKVNLGTK